GLSRGRAMGGPERPDGGAWTAGRAHGPDALRGAGAVAGARDHLGAEGAARTPRRRRPGLHLRRPRQPRAESHRHGEPDADGPGSDRPAGRRGMANGHGPKTEWYGYRPDQAVPSTVRVRPMTTGPTEQIEDATEAPRSELPHWPSVSVVVPTHNRPQLLKGTVQSILNQR